MALSRPSPRLIGALFLGTAVGFLVWFAIAHLKEMPALDWRAPRVLGQLAAAVMLSLAGLAAMAAAWRVLLRGFGENPRGVRAEMIDLATQAAKYIPGNVAHLVGRVALAKAQGFGATRSTAAVVLQHVLAGYAGVLLVLTGLAFTPGIYRGIGAYLPAQPLLLGLAAAGAVLPFTMGPVNRVVGRRLPERLRELGGQLDRLRKRDVAAALLLILVFYLLSGLAMIACARAVLGEPIALLPALAVFAAAWVAGTSTPGAPGGLGVREAVLSLGLTPVIGGGPALAVALVVRLATVLADGLATLAGSAHLRYWAREADGDEGPQD